MLNLSPLVLPGDPEFEWTLNTVLPATPPGVEVVYIQRPGSLVLEAVPPSEAYEYCMSGEYDERMAEIPDDEEEEEWSLEDFLI
jgi:hypothetical protein